MSNRVEELDLLRAISIIGVVIIHVFSNFVYDGSHPGLAIYSLVLSQWARFSVPVFLFVSGASLTIAHSHNFNYRRFLLRRFRIILVPYFFWSLVFEFNKGNMNSFSFHGLSHILSDLVQGNSPSEYYFIPMIMQFYLLYPLFLRVSAIKKELALVTILFAVIQILAIFIDTVLETSYGAKPPHAIEGFFPLWIFYFALGCLWWSLRQNFESASPPQLLLKILLIVFSLTILPFKFLFVVGMIGAPRYVINQETQYFRGEMLSFFVLSLPLLWYFAEAIKCKGGFWFKSTLKVLGRYSFGIYLVHLLFINFVISVSMKADNDFLECILLTLGVPFVVGVSMALLWFLEKIPIFCEISTLVR